MKPKLNLFVLSKVLSILPAQYKGISSFVTRNDILGSLSNHDDDGNKNPQICIFDNEKQYFCTLCTCIFNLMTL